MGRAKQAWIEAQEAGFDIDSDLCVCPDCFEDRGIIELIVDNGSPGHCSYCNKNSPSICPLAQVVEHILDCINTEWGNPACEGLAWESREGGWQGLTYDTTEVLFTVGFETNHASLFDEIVDSIINTEWCKRDPYSLSKDQTLYYGWQAFSEFVLHEARYMFLKATPEHYDADQHDEMHPVKILESLSEIVNDFGMIQDVHTDTSIYRVRIVNSDENISNAAEIGAPPKAHAILPNRMSPAGVPMFYGAFNTNTAIIETYDPGMGKGKKYVCGDFKPAYNLKCLDLTDPPTVPSIFELEKHSVRPALIFLRQFLKDFSKTIQRDKNIHVEYVPTQVVTEYFKYMHKPANGSRLDGIMYRSSKDPKEVAIVVFANNEECVDEIVEGTWKTPKLILEKISEGSL